MTFVAEALQSSPNAVRTVALPRRTFFRLDEAGKPVSYHPSPVDWAGEVLYFILPDRFKM